ncbi:lytic transglycosylase domain-containing protein [Methylobacillus sp.]|uniref:lytic transglycosylase domain-containing protein n=1 Tax=Methylobacillus sp. TaxID=56818 RepID=UPI002FDFF880
MNSVTVEELVMRIEVELDKFRAQAGQAEAIDKKLRQSLKDTEKAARETGDGFDSLGDDVAAANKQLESKLKTLATATRRLVGFFAVITGSNAIQRLATNIADANDQLRFLSQRLGMAASDVTKLDNAVAALGGTNAQAVNTIKSLNQGIQEMVIMGNDSLIPFFGALGVGVTNAAGNVREMDDILLDMADSLSRMDPQRAYAIASAMGLDDGVANALIQGRDAMQEMLDMQKTLYVSTQAELDASRELNKAQVFLSKQWEGLKTIIGNAIIPHLLRMTKIVSGWLEYLHRNERTVKNFFEGMAIALGVVLIPLLVKGALAMLAFVAPVLAAGAAVGILALGFAALYDDYKTWAEGGKSLFDWSGFVGWINKAHFSVDGLATGFTHLLTGYKTWAEAGNALFDWAKSKGLIDENGIAVRNLGKAIKGLAKDAIESVPLLKALVDVVSLMIEGKWSEAASRLMDVPGLAMKAGYDVTGFVAERAAGAIDLTFGVDPESDQSAAAAVRRLRGWGNRKLNRLFGGEQSAAPKSPAPATGGDRFMPAPELLPEFEIAAEKHNVPVAALIAMAHQESRFNPNAYNEETQATGMFQYIPATAKALGIDPRDPLQSLDAAAMQLRQRLDKGDTIEEAIRHHHGGPNRKRWGKNNDAYARDVLGKMSAIEARSMSSGFVGAGGGTGGGSRSMEVNIGSVNVQTSATTLPAATSEGVAAGVKQSNEMLNQLAGGIQ